MRELLAKGAKIEAVDKDGKTALIFALSNGHMAVVREPPGPGRGGPLGSKSEVGALNVLEVLCRVWLRWWACGGCSACFALSSLATRSPRLRRR